jgi:peptidoglycan/LPS O-acetylase OafA/YrhL
MSIAVAPSTGTRAEAHAARFYRPELDALRFFAFLGVFVFHAVPLSVAPYQAAGIPHWLTNVVVWVAGSGVYGVDLFFALSAYLITTLLLRERETRGDIDVRGFYLRRVLRIWPLYFSFVAFSALLSLFPWTGQKLPFHYIAGYCLLAGNWAMAVYGAPISVAGPLWTVSIEEQFYLLWPLAMRRATVVRMARIAVGVLVVDNLYRVVIAASGASLVAMKSSTFTRIDPIALGILLAVFSDKIPRLSSRKRAALLLAGWASWVAIYAFCFSSTRLLTLGYPVAALASAAIMVSFLGSQHPFLKNKQLLYLGKISYGLYVIHEFGLWCASHIVHPAKPSAKVVELGLGLAFTVLFAAASYRWLESPFLRLKERFACVPSRPV